VEAGADCVFIPGAIDKTIISKLVQGINAPINIILNGVFNVFESLEKIGVRRLSTGSAPVRYVYNRAIELADNLRNGNVAELLVNKFSYVKANDYFEKISKR
jgi:2-methylisocitrate lyase-like PEP mutase family enzyme